MIARQALIDAYLEACETELQAFKPGNVSVYSACHDMTVEDFRTSARVSADPITAPDFNLGERIYRAVEATRGAVACNTNLGIILLCAPLVQSAMTLRAGQRLRERLTEVLDSTTVDDADWVFKAIRLAAPGGLGASDAEDVNDQPTVTLKQAMAIAAERDRIALQFTNGFKDVFEFGILQYNRAFVWFGKSEWAALAVFAHLLSCFPDSHIERKYGKQYSEWIAGEMARLCRVIETTSEPDKVLPMLFDMDKAFKAKKINPGTTADMTVATVLTVLLERLVEADVSANETAISGI